MESTGTVSARVRKRAAFLAVLALPIAFVLPGQAEASPHASAATGYSNVEQTFVNQVGTAFLNNQTVLQKFKGWLIAQPQLAESGYVGSVDDPATKSTALLWYGAPTGFQAELLAKAKSMGITAGVRQRKYSLTQINEAVAQIWAQSHTSAWSGFQISGIAAIAADYDGIVVDGVYTGTDPAARSAAVRSASTTVLGVPVTVAAGQATADADGSRDTDFSPFNAGGLMAGSGSTICSSGFAISINGTTHITTARHCTETPWTDVDDSSEVYGNSVENSGGGAAKILTASGVGLAFDGAWNSVGYTKYVIGFGDVSDGDYVCTGGGNSGEHCNVEVINLSYSFNDGTGNGSVSTIEGEQMTSGGIAVIQGDSGGPVITLPSTAGDVYAAGMIQGLVSPSSTGSACGPVYFAGSNECSRYVLFTSTRTIVNSISGAALVTG